MKKNIVIFFLLGFIVSVIYRDNGRENMSPVELKIVTENDIDGQYNFRAIFIKGQSVEVENLWKLFLDENSDEVQQSDIEYVKVTKF